eukprot:183793-Alexandrium_andersonii.AAC.1
MARRARRNTAGSTGQAGEQDQRNGSRHGTRAGGRSLGGQRRLPPCPGSRRRLRPFPKKGRNGW